MMIWGLYRKTDMEEAEQGAASDPHQRACLVGYSWLWGAGVVGCAFAFNRRGIGPLPSISALGRLFRRLGTVHDCRRGDVVEVQAFAKRDIRVILADCRDATVTCL